MEKISTGSIVSVDVTVRDLLVPDIQMDREHVQGPTETKGAPCRPQLFISIDPFSRLIVACRLSYEEIMSDNSCLPPTAIPNRC